MKVKNLGHLAFKQEKTKVKTDIDYGGEGKALFLPMVGGGNSEMLRVYSPTGTKWGGDDVVWDGEPAIWSE